MCRDQRIEDTILRNRAQQFYHNYHSKEYDPAHLDKQGHSTFERVRYLGKVCLDKIIILLVRRESYVGSRESGVGSRESGVGSR